MNMQNITHIFIKILTKQYHHLRTKTSISYKTNFSNNLIHILLQNLDMEYTIIYDKIKFHQIMELKLPSVLVII